MKNVVVRYSMIVSLILSATQTNGDGVNGINDMKFIECWIQVREFMNKKIKKLSKNVWNLQHKYCKKYILYTSKGECASCSNLQELCPFVVDGECVSALYGHVLDKIAGVKNDR